MKLKLSIFLLAAVVFLALSSSAQVRFKIPVVYTDTVFLGGDNPTDTTGLTFFDIYRDTIWFGVHDLGSICRDTLSGFTTHWTLADTGASVEELLPPTPPSGREIKFTSIDARQGCFTDGSKLDIRSFSGGLLRDSVRFKQGADNNPQYFHREVLRWPATLASYFDSCRLRNIGSTPVNVDMRQEFKATSILFNASLLASHNFRITFVNPKSVPSVPTVTLLTPADGATDIALNPTLTWSPAAGALFYRIQVSKNDPNFGSANLIANDSLGSATTSKALVNLTGGTNYYWRVAVFTVGGVSFFQNPPFRFTTLVLTLQTVCDLPANGASGVSTAPTLTWHPIPNSTGATNYHVQVATDSNFTALIVNDSTLVSPSRALAVQNCLKYYWRARTKNSAGWGPFSNQPPTNPRPTFSFRVTLATPATPVLTSPADGATGVPSPALFSWQNDACGDSTRIQITADTSGTPVFIYDQTVSGSSASVPGLLQNATLFWRATAVNGLPSSSSPSFYRRFTTLLQPPATPALTLPADLDSAVSLSPAFSWSTVPYTDTYTLKVYRDAGFTQKVYDDSSLTGSTQVVGGLENCTRYFWKVKAKNAAGSSAFSAARNFKTVKAAPGAAPLLSPVNGQQAVPFTPRLIWSRPDLCADYYIVTIARDTNFTIGAVRDSTIDTTIIAGPLLALTKYYWKVEAFNKFQGSVAYNEFSFVVTDQTPPGVPVLSYPSNGQDGLPSGFTLRWDSTDKASTYRVQVSYDSLFTLLLVNDSTVAQSPNPGKTIGPLLNSRTYWWRVNAKNAKGTSEYSSVWTFRTLSPPSAPTLIAPGNGATSVSVSPTFIWTIPERADSYRLQVAKDAGFVQVVVDDSNIVSESWSVAGTLKGISTYHWRVFGKNSVGYGDTSLAFVFTTQRVGAADWAIPISICETGPACDTLEFGIDPSATYGIDYPLGEYELPQPPPSGWFDVRFIDARPVSEIGEGLRINAHPFRSYTQIDTFKVKFQPGLGTYPMVLSWNAAFISTICDSMVIKDEYTGTIVHQRMDLASSVSTGLSSLLIIEYGAFPIPLGVKPPQVKEVPKGFVLSQNYPNPFNPSTRIDFSTDKPAFVTLAVYDVLGREVSQLANEPYGPGSYHAEWNGLNREGHAMPSGVYYVRMLVRPSQDEGAPFSAVRKIIMMK